MRRRTVRGFTLVELMVVVTIVGILLVIGLPNFRSTMQSNRVATTSNELLGSISLARGDAITTTQTSGICPANAAGTACEAAATTWTNGWLVWRNPTAATADYGYSAGTDTLLRYVQPKTSMSVSVPVSSNGSVGNMLVFDARGRLVGTAPGAPRSVTMLPADCTPGRPFQRVLAVSALGQVTTTKGNCP
jgi:type IV fimbrial biogenesis protein FimT